MLTVAVRAASGLAVVVVASRIFGVTGFGQFSYALVVGTLLSLLVDYGLDVKLTRDASLDRDRLPAIVAATTLAKALLLVPVVLLFVLLTQSRALDPSLSDVSFLMLLAQVFYSFTRHLLAPFRVEGEYKAEFRWTAVTEAMMVVSFAIGAVTLETPSGAALGALIARVGGLATLLWVSKSRYSFRASPQQIVSELTAGLPFAIHSATAAVYLNIDVLILSKFVSTYDLGIYQAGVRLVVAACILTLVAPNVFVPRLANVFATPDIFRMTKRRFLWWTVAVGLVITSAVVGLRDRLIDLLFGSDFTSLRPLMTGFGVVILLRYIGSAYGALLTVVPNGQTVRAIAAAASIGVVVVGNFITAPRYGIQGALTVMVLAHLIINGAYVIYWHFVVERSSRLNQSLSS